VTAVPRKCEVCGLLSRRVILSSKVNMLLCDKHQAQVSRHGKILERTIYMPNKIHDVGDVLAIEIYERVNGSTLYAFIDKADREKVIGRKWGVHGLGSCYIKSKEGFLHHAILPLEEGKVVDHINGRPFDNRRSNLRLVTQRDNNMNRQGTSKLVRDYLDHLAAHPGDVEGYLNQIIGGKENE
jgi:hypothetical protein